jgi:hypothetical protein
MKVRAAANFGLLLAAAIWSLAPVPASAQVHEKKGAVEMLHGGVGAESRETMERSRDQYNLRLQFVAKGSGEYLADVRLRIDNEQGQPVVDTTASGPWLFAKLPNGSYILRATSADQTLTHRISIKDGWRGWVFRF